jgi:hypothetical protein
MVLRYLQSHRTATEGNPAMILTAPLTKGLTAIARGAAVNTNVAQILVYRGLATAGTAGLAITDEGRATLRADFVEAWGEPAGEPHGNDGLATPDRWL